MTTNPKAAGVMGEGVKPLECKSRDGILVGLLDSIMTIATVAAGRLKRIDLDSMPECVSEACSDLFSDRDLRFLISFGGNREYGDEPHIIEHEKLMAEGRFLLASAQPHEKVAADEGGSRRWVRMTDAEFRKKADAIIESWERDASEKQRIIDSSAARVEELEAELNVALDIISKFPDTVFKAMRAARKAERELAKSKEVK